MNIHSSPESSSFKVWQELTWNPSLKQIKQFISLQKLLKQSNQQVNLTRLVDGEDFWIGQIFDSLWPLKEELINPDNNWECIDVGSGCGLPGLAIAIALPKTKITLVDSVSRKTTAIKHIVSELGISSRVRVRSERVEKTAHNSKFRGMFDLAVARAVASAPVVAEYLVPLLRDKGEALIYKGQWNKPNQIKLQNALISLKAKINKIEHLDLPKNRGVRHVIRVSSDEPCPDNFPRSIGIPTKRPLGN